MADIRLVWNPVTGTADFAMIGSALDLSRPLETAVLISLFTNAQADEGDIVYDADPQGWWADIYASLEDPTLPELPNDRIGSKLWQVFARPRNQDTLNWVFDQVGKCLAWMLNDGAASAIDVAQPFFTTGGGVRIIVSITANGVPTVYSYAWSQET